MARDLGGDDVTALASYQWWVSTDGAPWVDAGSPNPAVYFTGWMAGGYCAGTTHFFVRATYGPDVGEQVMSVGYTDGGDPASCVAPAPPSTPPPPP